MENVLPIAELICDTVFWIAIFHYATKVINTQQITKAQQGIL